MSHPADVLNLKNKWKVTLPVGSEEGVKTKKNGDACEVLQPELADFVDKKNFCVTDDGKGVVMRVHHGDPTTKGSKNPRCELREMKGDGSKERNWKGSDGTHTLTVVGQVNRLTKKTRTVVLAQVHGKDDDVTVFRLEGDTLCVTDGDGVAFRAPKPLPLKTQYTLTIEVKDGTTRYWFNGDKLDFKLTNKDPENYFKAGNYLQSNPKKNSDEVTSEYSEVVLYSVTTSHDD